MARLNCRYAYLIAEMLKEELLKNWYQCLGFSSNYKRVI